MSRTNPVRGQRAGFLFWGQRAAAAFLASTLVSTTRT
jgi:hypothetical protein